jgi:5-methylcytosine-specific restriction endonuclease McrA
VGLKLSLEGKTINSLECLSFSHFTKNGKSCWNFRCSCGGIFCAIGSNVKSGRTNSCGICVKTKDLTGKTFGQWTVLGKAGYVQRWKAKRGFLWLCKCACGTTAKVLTASLNNGTSKSCGNCISAEKSIAKLIFTRYKSEAKARKRNFTLTLLELESLIFSNCFYCNAPPSNIKKGKRKIPGHLHYNGIDRVNSKIGYIKENCVSCCYHCNLAKSDYSLKEFLTWIKRLRNNLDSVLTEMSQEDKIELEHLRETLANNKESSGNGWGD